MIPLFFTLAEALAHFKRNPQCHCMCSSKDETEKECRNADEAIEFYAVHPEVPDLENQLQDVIDLGKKCVVDITGAPDDAADIVDFSTAMQVIKESLRLGKERNDEANALRQELARLKEKQQ